MQQDINEEQISIKDYIRILYRGRWIIAVSFIIVLAITVYFTFTAQPIYEAKALVMIREQSNVQQQVFEVTSFIKQETMINNQKEILESRTLAENVIKQLQDSPFADSLSYLGNYKDGNNFSPKKWLLS
ncbi:MAG: Wzz/FepE/Etk N-terminal domain-containing protein, partial [bacterium]